MRFSLASFALVVCLSTTAYTESSPDRENFKKAYSAYQIALKENDKPTAISKAEEAYHLGKALFGTSHANTAALALNYGRLLSGREAQAVLKEALKLHQNAFGSDAIELVDPLIDLAKSMVAYQNLDNARRHFKRALNLIEKHDSSDGFLAGLVNLEMGQIALSKAQSVRAIKYLKTAENIFTNIKGDNAKLHLAKVKFWQGKYRLATRKYKKAEEKLLASLDIFEHYIPQASMTLTNHAFLIEAYEKQGLRDSATKHCLAIGASKPFNPDQDFLPVFFVQPSYPRSALFSNQEGFVIVSLTVDENGFVEDPTVIDSGGSRHFHKAALEAAEQFRYVPRFENNQPTKTEDVRYKFTFDIAD